jgi:hypothetical protein
MQRDIVVHPLYNKALRLNTWIPARGYKLQDDKTCTLPGVQVMLLDGPDCFIRVRVNSKELEVPKDGHMTLCKAAYKITAVSLASALCDVQPTGEVVHVDGDQSNWRIANLCWEGTQDGGGPVDMLELSGGFIRTFVGAEAAARFLRKSGLQGDSMAERIASSCNDGRQAFGNRWRWSVNDDPTEQWLDIPAEGGVCKQVSNRGRIRDAHGQVTRGNRVVSSLYRQFCMSVGGKVINEYVHRVVWSAFKGPIPEDEDVLHNDLAPLIEGSYRNHLEDLYLGRRAAPPAQEEAPPVPDEPPAREEETLNVREQAVEEPKPKQTPEFFVKGDVGFYRNSCKLYIFDSKHIESIQKIAWSVVGGCHISMKTKSARYNSALLKAYPDITDYFKVDKLYLHQFVYFYLDKKQPMPEEAVIEQINGMMWDARSANLRVSVSVNKHTEPVLFEDDVALELGLQFPPLDVRFVKGRNGAHKFDAGNSIVSTGIKMVSLRTKLDSVMERLRVAYRDRGQDYDEENKAYVWLVESALQIWDNA